MEKDLLTALNELSALLKPILDEYLTEKSTVEKQITMQGTIPTYFCEKCPRHSIFEVQRLSIGEYVIPDLIDWMNENEIRDLNSNGKTIQFNSSFQKVEGIKGTPLIKVPDGEPSLYGYSIPLSVFSKKPLHELLLRKFERIDNCSHLDENTIKKGLPTLLITTPRFTSFGSSVYETLKKRRDKVLRFLCSECYGRIDSIGCDDGITRRSSFVFDYHCPIKQILLQTLFDNEKIEYKAPELQQWINRWPSLFLIELKVLITDEKDVKNYLEKFDTECILAFGSQKDIFNYIHLGVNVIIFDDSDEATKRYFLFDKDKVVEDSLGKIIKAIIDKLDVYTEEERGNEHERLVRAFQRIGRDLGFITQQELPIKGTRIDAAWLDRKGIVKLAIEVETTSTWKKDIVSTWEAQPQLSIILVHDKTNKGIKELTQYTLLKSMPHKLLFINYSMKKAYLVEKQEIIKWFDLENKRESTESDILEL